jgi:chromosome segregation ATPase
MVTFVHGEDVKQSLYSLGVKIAELAQIGVDLKKVQEKLDKHVHSLEWLENNFGHLSESLEGTMKLMEKKDRQIRELEEKLAALDRKFEDYCQETGRQLNEIDTSLHCQMNEITELRELDATVEVLTTSLGEHRHNNSLWHSAHNSEIKNIGNRCNEIASKLEGCIELNKHHENIMDKLDCAVAGMDAKLVEQQRKIDSLSNVQSADSIKQDLKKHVAESLAAFRSVPGASKEELNQMVEMGKQIALMGIDVKNAFLKATNVDTLQKMQEKKIENIYLLLRKHELSQ